MFWDGTRWVDERAWEMRDGIFVRAGTVLPAPKPSARPLRQIAVVFGAIALAIGVLADIGDFIEGPLPGFVRPTATPTAAPTATPTAAPTATPTAAPTATPTAAPTATPTYLLDHGCDPSAA
jgi:hypothetical protein